MGAFLVRELAPALILACAAPVAAQTLLMGSGGAVRIVNTDMAVLEIPEPRKDLPCTVVPSKPVLGFDLRFHAKITNLIKK